MKRFWPLVLTGFILLALILPILLSTQVTTRRVMAQDSSKPPYTTTAYPRAMAFDGQWVWIANWADNSITRLNAADGVYIDTIAGPLTVGNQPISLAWDGTHMWVANYQDNTVYRLPRIGAEGGVPESNAQFSAGQGIQKPIALFYDGSAHIWVVNQHDGKRNGTVTKIVADTLEILGTYDVGRFPTAITWDGINVWVANGLDDTLTVIDGATGDEVGVVSIVDDPAKLHFPISLAFDGRFVWVSGYDRSVKIIRNNSLDVYDTEELEAADMQIQEELPNRPIYLYYAFERIWISSADEKEKSILNLRAASGIEVNTIDTGEFPATMVAIRLVGPDGNEQKNLWVASWLNYTIQLVTLPDNELIDTENGPQAVAANPLIWLPTDVPTPTPTIAPTATLPACNPALPSRLRPGDEGRIEDKDDPTPLNFRDAAGFNSNVMKSIAVGTEFVVLSGPVCIENKAWYEVRLSSGDSAGESGWFVESIERDGVEGYTIEPKPE